MNSNGTCQSQKKLTYSAIQQYESHRLDHNLIQGQIDGFVHYHQGFVSDEFMGRPRSDKELDELLHSGETQLASHLIDKIEDYVPHPKNVLDVGCGKMGTGIICFKRNRQSIITGIDISRMSVDYAKRHPCIAKYKDNFNVIAGDYLTSAFEDKSFDAIYAMESLQFCLNIKPLFKKWRKMITDQGVVVLSQMVSNETLPAERVAKCIAGVNVMHDSVIHTEIELVDALEKAQFEIVEVNDLSHYVSNYWRLRVNYWGFKTYMDRNIQDGYENKDLRYVTIVARPKQTHTQ